IRSEQRASVHARQEPSARSLTAEVLAGKQTADNGRIRRNKDGRRLGGRSQNGRDGERGHYAEESPHRTSCRVHPLNLLVGSFAVRPIGRPGEWLRNRSPRR